MTDPIRTFWGNSKIQTMVKNERSNNWTMKYWVKNSRVSYFRNSTWLWRLENWQPWDGLKRWKFTRWPWFSQKISKIAQKSVKIRKFWMLEESRLNGVISVILSFLDFDFWIYIIGVIENSDIPMWPQTCATGICRAHVTWFTCRSGICHQQLSFGRNL